MFFWKRKSGGIAIASSADTPPRPDKSESAAPPFPALEKHKSQRWHKSISPADAHSLYAALTHELCISDAANKLA